MRLAGHLSCISPACPFSALGACAVYLPSVTVTYVTATADQSPLGRLGQWLTVSEVAAVLRRSPRTIRRWCVDGPFAGHAKPVGRAWLIPISVVEALLAPVDAVA